MAVLKLCRINSHAGKSAAIELINALSGLLVSKTPHVMSDKTFFCAKVNEQVVGITGYRQINRWLVEQVHTVVLPKYRGLGYGRTISDNLTEMLLKMYGKVFCTVNEKNKHMVCIKESQDFKQEGFLRDHFAEGRNIIVFSKTRKEKSNV